jgi:protein-disulfide isomerase
MPVGVVDGTMSYGPADAPVTVEWFADLTSGLHQDAAALMKRVVNAHPLDVRTVFRHHPLDDRPDQWLIHEATVAAADQRRFWDMHHLLLRRPLLNREAMSAAAGGDGRSVNHPS